MNRDLLRRDAEEARQGTLVHRMQLFTVPHRHAVGSALHDAVHGFHRRVRQVRKAILGLQHLLRRIDDADRVAALGRRSARFLRPPRVVLVQRRGAAAPGAAVVPADVERVATPAGTPEVLRHDGHAAVDGQHLFDAVQRQRPLGIEAFQGRAKTRRVGHQRHAHVGQLHVLREQGAAVGLVAVVHARGDLADEHELLRRLERHRLWHRLFRGGGHQFTEAGTATGFGVAHDAPRDADLGGGHAPLGRRRGDQHRPGAGAGLAHLLEGVGDAGAAAGALHAHEQVRVPRDIGGSALDPNGAPVRIQFLGHQRRQAGVDALPHLQVLGQHGDGAVAVDGDEGVGGQPPGRLRSAPPPGQRQHHRQAERGAAAQEAAAGNVADADPCRRSKSVRHASSSAAL